MFCEEGELAQAEDLNRGIKIDMTTIIGSKKDWINYITNCKIWQEKFELNNILSRIHRVNSFIYRGHIYVGVMATSFNRAPGIYLRQCICFKFKREKLPTHLIYPLCGFMYVFDYENPFQLIGYY